MEQKSNNATIGIIIVILILVIGGYFLYRSSIKDRATVEPSTTEPSKVQPVAVPGGEVAPTVEAPNGDISAVEAELNALDLEGLDQGI